MCELTERNDPTPEERARRKASVWYTTSCMGTIRQLTYALILIIGGYAGILLAARMNGLIVAGRRGGRGEEWFNLIEFALGIGSTFCLIGGGLLLMALAIWYWAI